MKLGKKPARPGAVRLRFSAYHSARAPLPPHPVGFGHNGLIAANDWAMLANDRFGCCVWAGAAHETRLWNYEGGKPTFFSEHAVLSDYAAVTGFSPTKPDSDQGTDMALAAAYRRRVGVLDGHGQRHQIAAYLALTPGNVEQHLEAAWLFGAIGIGLEMPSDAEALFDAGKPWDVTGSAVEGGHYVPLVGCRDNYLLVVTWGRVQRVTPRFLAKYNDESLAYLSNEAMTAGKSPEGFAMAALQSDLQTVGAA